MAHSQYTHDRLRALADALRSRHLCGAGEQRIPALAADLRSLAASLHYLASEIDDTAEVLAERYVLADDSAGIDAARIVAAERLAGLLREVTP